MIEKPPSFESAEPQLDFEAIKREALEKLFSFETQEFFIDKGGVGKVYQLPGGFCLKVMEARHRSPNRDLLDLGNTPFQEAMLQERMANTAYDGPTRVPRMLGVIQPERMDIDGAIIMERLNAVNLQHVIKGEAELPEGFDLEGFFDELERFTLHMHDNEGIIHNDLFARNVMVDVSGAPRMIDFGRSRYADRISDARERERLMNLDLDRLDQSYEELKKALQERE